MSIKKLKKEKVWDTLHIGLKDPIELQLIWWQLEDFLLIMEI